MFTVAHLLSDQLPGGVVITLLLLMVLGHFMQPSSKRTECEVMEYSSASVITLQSRAMLYDWELQRQYHLMTTTCVTLGSDTSLRRSCAGDVHRRIILRWQISSPEYAALSRYVISLAGVIDHCGLG